eukprot:g3087.t1
MSGVVAEEQVTNMVEETTEETPVEEENTENVEESSEGPLIMNRGEKKARKTVSRMGFKTFSGVGRVTIKKAKDQLYEIKNPTVFKSPTSETYVVFGKAEPLDQAKQMAAAKQQAAQAFKMPIPQNNASGSTPAATDSAASQDASGDAEEDLDETGLKQEDIDLCISQVHCSRAQAVKALRASNGDLVEAILKLNEGEA